MSTSEESRNKRSTSQRQSTSTRDGNQQNQQSRKVGKPSNSVNKPANSSPAPSPLPRDDHPLIEGFNVTEVENMLRNGYDAKSPVYKSELNPTNNAQPWNTKSGAMASGKDFWLELRKQVAALQKGENMNKGG